MTADAAVPSSLLGCWNQMDKDVVGGVRYGRHGGCSCDATGKTEQLTWVVGSKT